MRRLIFASLALLASAACLSAQNFTTTHCQDTGNDHRGGFMNWVAGQEHACEVRSATLPLNGALRVKGQNGGIEVVGEDRSNIALEARVDAHAHSQADADSLLHKISIRTNGLITADGPTMVGAGGWSVSWRLRVPRHLAAELETSNGAIKLAALEGDLQAQTTNGSLSLHDLAGNVRAQTTNGSADVAFAGNTWHGRGLAVQSTNGSLHIQVPGNYSAHLAAQTTNGGISSDFPNQGSSRRHSTLDANISSGGPTLEFTTTNGHIAFTRN